MKVLHVTPSFYPAFVYGGPTRSVHGLCRGLTRAGCDVRVLTTNANGPRATLAVPADVETLVDDELHVRYCRRAGRDSVSVDLVRRLPALTRWADVVHLTAVYSFPTIPTLMIARAVGTPVVWSPRGALQRWAGSRRTPSKAVWERACRLMLPRDLAFHVTSAEEGAACRARFPGRECHVIANGVDAPDRIDHRPGDGTLRLLSLGRLDPIKGLENLLDACTALPARGVPRWRLVVAGAGTREYSDALRERAATLSIDRQVEFVGQVDGDAKRDVFASADLLVCSSHVENFGLVVAEALAHGVPVVVSRGAPWQAVEDHQCGVWVENSSEGLADGIRRISTMPLRAMGERGRAWMAREFSWSRIAGQMREIYGALRDRRVRPAAEATPDWSRSS